MSDEWREKQPSQVVSVSAKVLRSLRFYLQAQSQGHHTINRLYERGIEKGSARRSSLKGRGWAAVNHTNTGAVPK